MYESDMMFQIRSDFETTAAIITMAYEMSQPFTDEQKAAFIDGPIPEGALNKMIMWQSKYMIGSVAYVANVIYGREVNLSIIRTNFGGKVAHHITKKWKNHSPSQLLTLVYNFGMFEPLRRIKA